MQWFRASTSVIVIRMPAVILHDHALARERADKLAKQDAAAMARYRPMGVPGVVWKPDKNSRFARASRVADLQRTIQLREGKRRGESGESVKPFNRKKDYYERLELDRAASAAEIRRAFRRLSLRYHPDKQLGRSTAEAAEAAVLFAELKEAHEALSHEATRREYDQMLAAGDLAGDLGINLDDLEEALRKAQPPPRRAPPTYYEVEATLEELHAGCDTTLRE